MNKWTQFKLKNVQKNLHNKKKNYTKRKTKKIFQKKLSLRPLLRKCVSLTKLIFRG